MEICNPIPTCYRDDPLRRAELTVRRHLEQSDRPGKVLHGVKPPGCPELDFVMWAVGETRDLLQVKGGQYARRAGHWYRREPAGELEVDDPTQEAFQQAMSLNRFLKSRRQDNRCPYVVPVLLFPDMPAGHALETDAHGQAVVVCGTEDLVDRILERVREGRDIYPSSILTEADCEREVALLLPDIPAEADCEREAALLPPAIPAEADCEREAALLLPAIVAEADCEREAALLLPAIVAILKGLARHGMTTHNVHFHLTISNG